MSSIVRAMVLLWLTSFALAFDHTYANYQVVLDRYVREGRVDYAALKQDRTSLDSFIAAYADVTFEQYRAFTKNEKLAFLINLYNAATLQLIVDHYPVESIQDIGGFFSSPWNVKFVKLFGHTISLGQIEHDILRAEFEEPRILFSIVRAARGCPLLNSQACRDTNISAMLAQAERHFLTQRPTDNRFEDGQLFVSPIFKWYRDDFGGDDGVRTLFQLYFPEVKRETRLNYTDYDWGLNAQ